MMLMPIEGDLETAYNNVNRLVIRKRGYSPMTPRMMGAWWREETGLKLVYDEMNKVLCIDFEDYHDLTWFLLKYSS